MEMLEQIIDTAEQTFDRSSKGHLIMPAITDCLQRDGIYMIRHESTVWTCGMANSLVEHTAKNRCKSLLILVGMLPHALNRASYPHLTARDVDGCIDEIEVRQLSVHSVIYNVQFVEAMAPSTSRIVQCYCRL